MSADLEPATGALAFGPFRLFPSQQLLVEGEKHLRLGSRALDILRVLVEQAGTLVTKDELIARVWPGTFVEEGNLRVHMAALRKALGDGQAGNQYISTVPGRGYRFVADVSPLAQPSPVQTTAEEVAYNLPSSLARMIGRADVVRSLVAQFGRYRLITIVGPGGIGKTTVALAVANELTAFFGDRVRFVDLAPLTSPLVVASAVAAALDVPVRSDNPLPALTAHLKDKEMLLVLDSCEHVIEAAAGLAETIVKGAPLVRILVTSREALRAEGEVVVRLPPLGLPPDSSELTAAEALTFPAVQLFVECAAACLDSFDLSNADAPIVSSICRKLDGIALAIQMAASRVDSFGVRGVSDCLDNRLRLLSRGRRTALPRHQTLSATQDWSHELLSEPLRMVFRRLSVFAGWFTSDSASAVVPAETLPASDVINCVADLVAKSLVVANVDGPTPCYRLLDTTRAYALQKLTEAGEVELVSRSHASHYLALFERAEAEWENRPTVEWLADYRWQIDNLRAALDWTFSPAGEVTVGVSLTVAAIPLWFQLSLINECRERVERALAALDPNVGQDDRRQMKLYAALGWSLMYTTGPERPTSAAWQTALKLAEDLDDVDYQLRALWGLWASCYNNGEFREVLALAERFAAMAVNSPDPSDPFIGDRMMGVALHFLGDQAGARRHIECMLSNYVAPEHRSDIVRFQFEQRVTARITLARVLWLQGFADQALRLIESNIDEAVAIEHTLSLCNALANAACPIPLLAGDLPAAERYIAMLSSQTERHALDIWRAYADAFRGDLLVKRGQLDGGLSLLRSSVGRLRDARFAQYQTAFLGVLAESLARSGRLDEGRTAIDEALLRCEQTEERWCMSELLRIRGEIALLDTRMDAAAVAEQQFLAGLDWADRQQALSWELRCAMSLARLRRRQGQVADARDRLASVYDRFTEGFGTADLRAAKQLLGELAS